MGLRGYGTVWHLDLPGDGSNITLHEGSFSQWSNALIEAVEALENVILVAHSTGGMYALAESRLENLLMGLVLMDSAPDASWQSMFMKYVKQHPIANVEELQKIYRENPNNDVLKNLIVASAPYLFTTAGLKKGIELLETLPFNYKSYEWSAKHFDSIYKAKWIPKIIPTLIIAGDSDHITPLSLFTESKYFQHDAILVREIKNAGHYPWVENPDQVIETFHEYCRMLQLKTV